MSPDHIARTLAQAFTLRNGQTVKNRIVKSAMSETLAGRENRVPEAMPRLYGRWAKGGLGLSITGNVMVDRKALGEPGNVALEDERDLDRLEQWAKAGKSEGGLIYMQLNHPGRQVPKYLNAEAVAPSAIPLGKQLKNFFDTPRALTDAEIRNLIERFARSAAIAEKSGFDGVQIHGAHGYLVSQFLSPLTNQRDDAWGGSPEKRRHFVLAIAEAIRASTTPGFGVAIKINSADFQRGGISEEESRETILALSGLDFVEVSGGTYEAPAMMGTKKKSTVEREAYFLTFAEGIRRELDAPLVVTGGFRSGGAMADAIHREAVDFVGLARTLAVAPDFPKRLTTEGDVRVEITPRRTGIGMIDRMGMLELTWYERQLHRMGAGKEPRPDENALYAAIAHGFNAGPLAFRTRRSR